AHSIERAEITVLEVLPELEAIASRCSYHHGASAADALEGELLHAASRSFLRRRSRLGRGPEGWGPSACADCVGGITASDPITVVPSASCSSRFGRAGSSSASSVLKPACSCSRAMTSSISTQPAQKCLRKRESLVF